MLCRITPRNANIYLHHTKKKRKLDLKLAATIAMNVACKQASELYILMKPYLTMSVLR